MTRGEIAGLIDAIDEWDRQKAYSYQVVLCVSKPIALGPPAFAAGCIGILCCCRMVRLCDVW